MKTRVYIANKMFELTDQGMEQLNTLLVSNHAQAMKEHYEGTNSTYVPDDGPVKKLDGNQFPW